MRTDKGSNFFTQFHVLEANVGKYSAFNNYLEYFSRWERKLVTLGVSCHELSDKAEAHRYQLLQLEARAHSQVSEKIKASDMKRLFEGRRSINELGERA